MLSNFRSTYFRTMQDGKLAITVAGLGLVRPRSLKTVCKDKSRLCAVTFQTQKLALAKPAVMPSPFSIPGTKEIR